MCKHQWMIIAIWMPTSLATIFKWKHIFLLFPKYILKWIAAIVFHTIICTVLHYLGRSFSRFVLTTTPFLFVREATLLFSCSIFLLLFSCSIFLCSALILKNLFDFWGVLRYLKLILLLTTVMRSIRFEMANFLWCRLLTALKSWTILLTFWTLDPLT